MSVQKMMSSLSFRVFTSQDTVGVQVGTHRLRHVRTVQCCAVLCGARPAGLSESAVGTAVSRQPSSLVSVRWTEAFASPELFPRTLTLLAMAPTTSGLSGLHCRAQYERCGQRPLPALCR